MKETLAAIPAENRIKLEAGIPYPFSLQITTSETTRVNPPLVGHIHGKVATVVPVYSGADGVFPPTAEYLQSTINPINTSAYVQLNGLIQYAKGTANGFLCIPYREKGKHHTSYTTNIIIPFTVIESAQPAATAEVATSPKAQPDPGIHNKSAVEKGSERILPQPIIGCTANVHAVRRSFKVNPETIVKGKGKRLAYTRDCPIEEVVPDQVEPELKLKVFPNPANGVTQVKYLQTAI